MVRKRLYAKRTASAEYEQLDLFGLLEEEQRQADRTAEQVRGYEITVGHVAVQRLRARGADVGGKLVVIGSKLDEKAIAALFGC